MGGNTGLGGWKQVDNEQEGGNQPGSEEGAGVMAMANGNGWCRQVDDQAGIGLLVVDLDHDPGGIGRMG